MAKRASGASKGHSESKALAKLDDGAAWRGDEHELRLAAAREAGLPTEDVHDVEVELFTEGFKAGMTVDDRADRSIVLRGRTILTTAQMSKALAPTLRFLSIPKDEVALQIHDGEFELRVARTVAEAAKPSLDAARVTLKIWFGFGIFGFVAWNMFKFDWLAAIVWGLGLAFGGYNLRQGTVSGRALLAARLTVALALLAKEEKLILPPSRTKGAEGQA